MKLPLLKSAAVGFELGVIPHADELPQLSNLFCSVVEALPYYNQKAKNAAFAKHSPAMLKEYLSHEPDSLMVAKAGPLIVGFCFNREDDGLIWLTWIGIRKDFRRQGVASALLRALDDKAKRTGTHKVWCDCRTDNESAKLMLGRCSYSQICAIPNHWYGQDYILWEKLIG